MQSQIHGEAIKANDIAAGVGSIVMFANVPQEQLNPHTNSLDKHALSPTTTRPTTRSYNNQINPRSSRRSCACVRVHVFVLVYRLCAFVYIRPVTSFRRRDVRFPLTLYLQKTSYYKHECNFSLNHILAQTHAHERAHGTNADC